MKILIVRQTSPIFSPTMDATDAHIRQIQSLVPDATIIAVSDTDTEKLHQEIADAEIVIIDSAKSIPFEKAKNLKWIQVMSAGVNGLPENIVTSDLLITNASGVHPIPIAEHVLTFMLMFAHQFPTLMKAQQDSTWDYTYTKYPIQELYEKTVAIFGIGRIGTRIAQLAKGFDMKVLAMVRDTSKKNQYVDEVFTKETMPAFLARADFVVNAMPLTSETKYFFNKDVFTLMKASSYFINIGRGPVAHEQDLIAALKNKTIAGAGLDVTEIEPLPSTSELWHMKNVIITPHSSGQTPEYMNRVINIFCENLKAYLEKKPMPNLVDKKRGY